VIITIIGRGENMINFEEKYKALIQRLCSVGNDENTLRYDTYDNTWEIQAVNNYSCVALGEVKGKIVVTGLTLGEVMLAFEGAIDKL
jgi:hypothetical protein